jgi:hypothetical protein
MCSSVCARVCACSQQLCRSSASITCAVCCCTVCMQCSVCAVVHCAMCTCVTGPPGTGKTLIARQIGKMLNGRDPKIISGPGALRVWCRAMWGRDHASLHTSSHHHPHHSEVLNKYVGQSEENIRAQFADAEKEQVHFHAHNAPHARTPLCLLCIPAVIVPHARTPHAG